MLTHRIILILLAALPAWTSLASAAQASDHRPPPSKRIVDIPPGQITYAGVKTDAPERPCPPESVDWPARRSGPFRPMLNRSTHPHLSPVYCVRIGRNGRVLAVYLALTSGDAALDRALRPHIARLRFHPARYGDRTVTAWHRILIRLGTLPEGLTGIVQRGPELTLSWYPR
jgi:hypothetical protein